MDFMHLQIKSLTFFICCICNSVLLIVFFVSCTTVEQHNNKNPYKTTIHDLNADAELMNTCYKEGYYFVTDNNNKVEVFDSIFNRQYNIEKKINQFPVSVVYCNNDSLIFEKSDDRRIGLPERYFVSDDFKYIKLKQADGWQTSQLPGEIMLEDSAYTICANRIGDHGFFTYFCEKNSKRIHVLFSYHPRQVIFHSGSYYIICDGNTTSGTIMIRNPADFTDITYQQAEKLNIQFTHLAVSQGKEYELLADSIKKRSPTGYGYPGRYSIPLYSFFKNEELYSIILTDSLIYLGKHGPNKIINIQSLFNTSFDIPRIYPLKYKRHTLLSFSSSGAKSIDGKMMDYFDCGYFDIKDSTIHLYRIYRTKDSNY